MASDNRPRASERRFSISESVHRLSIDLGVAVGALGPDEAFPTSAPPHGGQVRPELGIAASASTISANIDVVHNPVSIWFHTFRTNAAGMISAGPAFLFIIGTKKLADWLTAQGGPWADMHGARCAICMACLEASLFAVNFKAANYAKKRLIIGKSPPPKRITPPPS